MVKHAAITQKIGTAIYLADPHILWQRGSNENTNGLIRHYFPKGTNFRQVTDAEVRKVVKK